jgi:multidrug efflux pump subunit AcrA (membrane-fusion protein)
MATSLATRIVLLLAVLALTGCSRQPSSAGKAPGAGPGAAAGPPPAVPVIAMQVIQRDASVTGELVGQVSAFREVPLRAQTTGFVQKLLFQAGDRVREGQLLFVIDPRPYEAALQQAVLRAARSQRERTRAAPRHRAALQGTGRRLESRNPSAMMRPTRAPRPSLLVMIAAQFVT